MPFAKYAQLSYACFDSTCRTVHALNEFQTAGNDGISIERSPALRCGPAGEAMKRNVLIGAGGALAIIFIIAVSIYIRHSFVFNPLTFKHDAVTHAEWREYKYPIQVEYLVDDGGWKVCKVRDKSEVRFVFSQLKRVKKLPAGTGSAQQNGKRTVVVIRKVLGPEKSVVLVLFDGSEGGRVATLRTTSYTRVLLPEALTGLIAERLSEAEDVE